MKRHNLDSKVQDFTWKVNRLDQDKKSLKASMMDVIKKKPKAAMGNESGQAVAGGAQATPNH